MLFRSLFSSSSIYAHANITAGNNITTSYFTATSGTASVLEMATIFSDLIKEKGEPERTVRFCTWGGEEEGLWGSNAYVEEMNAELSENLRLYVNLDMNHVDIDQSRADSVTLFANHPVDYNHISNLTAEYKIGRAHV